MPNNIRGERCRADMTQAQLADAVGVSVGTVWRWESGYTDPSASEVAAMADVFGCTADYLLARTDERK